MSVDERIDCLSLIGDWSGKATFYSFTANSSTKLGNVPDMWSQENLLSIEEQHGNFVRGSQYYYQEDRSLFFVSNFYGVVEELGHPAKDICRLRLQEYMNKHVDTDETLGVLDALIYTKDLNTMHITYTGVSAAEKRFGAQTFTARKQS